MSQVKGVRVVCFFYNSFFALSIKRPAVLSAMCCKQVPDDGLPRNPDRVPGGGEATRFPHRAHLGLSTREGRWLHPVLPSGGAADAQGWPPSAMVSVMIQKCYLRFLFFISVAVLLLFVPCHHLASSLWVTCTQVVEQRFWHSRAERFGWFGGEEDRK